MLKVTLLTILMLTALAQDDTPESSASADGVAEPTSFKDLPALPAQPALPALAELKSAPERFSDQILADKALKDYQWVAQSITKPKWISTFTITYQTFCPNTVYLLITATGYFTVSINGAPYQIFYLPYPNIVKIPFTPLCQCNTIVVQVYQPWVSIARIAYNFVQSTTNCYTCTVKNFYWNYPTCKCECKLKCCPSGYSFDKTKCTCTRIRFGVGGIVKLSTEKAQSSEDNLSSSLFSSLISLIKIYLVLKGLQLMISTQSCAFRTAYLNKLFYLLQVKPSRIAIQYNKIQNHLLHISSRIAIIHHKQAQNLYKMSLLFYQVFIALQASGFKQSLTSSLLMALWPLLLPIGYSYNAEYCSCLSPDGCNAPFVYDPFQLISTLRTA